MSQYFLFACLIVGCFARLSHDGTYHRATCLDLFLENQHAKLKKNSCYKSIGAILFSVQVTRIYYSSQGETCQAINQRPNRIQSICLQVCKTAPLPGETKVWQYITMTKKVLLIDCPGVVSSRAGDSDTDAVLKGVVRVENLQEAADYIETVLARVKAGYLVSYYWVLDWGLRDVVQPWQVVWLLGSLPIGQLC